MKLKIKIKIQDQSIYIEAGNLEEIKKQTILQVYRNELKYAHSKIDAVLNTAVILGIGEATVWRAIKDEE